MIINNLRIVLISSFWILFFLFLALAAHFLWIPVVTNPSGFQYDLQPGTTIQKMVNDLTTQQVIQHPTLFKLLISLRGDRLNLKAGEYHFPKGTTPYTLLRQVTTGTGLLNFEFTIISGWNFSQVRKALARETKLLHTTAGLSDQEIMQRLGFSNMLPEGMFFPDTYFFIRNSSDLAVLKRALLTLQNKLADAWQKRDVTVPYKSPYEALIVASLLEKESRVNAERPMIAGVILNRLKKEMLLQIDFSVIYGLGERYDGVIHKKDLSENTPYNTYLHKGLPPTPIAMVSKDSLEAALHPQKNDYLYYVAKSTNPNDGHQFSKNASEHSHAIHQSKYFHPEFFNEALIRYYWQTIWEQQHEQTITGFISLDRRYRGGWEKYSRSIYQNLFAAG